jgi:hypothetical protein
VSRRTVAGHVFISYVRQDSDRVDQLQRTLQAAGIPVWRDTADLWPGEDWRARIRGAITSNALVFLACSKSGLARSKSYQNEELVLAIEQLRQRPPERPWLIPVRFDDCEIPDRDIGDGRTLTSIQRADLFGNDYGNGEGRLVAAILRILGRESDSASTETSRAPREEARPPTEQAPDSQELRWRAEPEFSEPVTSEPPQASPRQAQIPAPQRSTARPEPRRSESAGPADKGTWPRSPWSRGSRPDAPPSARADDQRAEPARRSAWMFSPDPLRQDSRALEISHDAEPGRREPGESRLTPFAATSSPSLGAGSFPRLDPFPEVSPFPEVGAFPESDAFPEAYPFPDVSGSPEVTSPQVSGSSEISSPPAAGRGPDEEPAAFAGAASPDTAPSPAPRPDLVLRSGLTQRFGRARSTCRRHRQFDSVGCAGCPGSGTRMAAGFREI